jgi:preprotein translocase subunit SecF
MSKDKKYLVLGIIIGLVLAFFYFHYFASRYEIDKTGLSTIKIDKWTGQSWRLVNDEWKVMLETEEDLEKIDNTLLEALHIPFAQVDSDSALKKLRDRYPALKDVSDDLLLERIKLVYSKQVLVNMYLGEFMKKSEGETEVSPRP